MKINKHEMIKLYKQGSSIEELAILYNTSKKYIHQRLNLNGIYLKKRGRWKEYAVYSLTHSIHETAQKFEVSKEAVHTARTRMKKIQSSLQVQE